MSYLRNSAIRFSEHKNPNEHLCGVKGQHCKTLFFLVDLVKIPSTAFNFLQTNNNNNKNQTKRNESKPNKKLNQINLKWLLDAYNRTPKDEKFFGPTFTAHAGTTSLQEQIEQGRSAEEIKKSWIPALDRFKKIRSKYLLYD